MNHMTNLEHITTQDRRWTFAALVMIVGLSACKPVIEGELGEPFDKRSGFVGTWEIVAFTQQDMNSPVNEIRDFSSFYLEDTDAPLKLVFSDDDNYTVEIEQGRNYFGSGGTWSFDDPDYPTYLLLEGASDTLQYNLGATIRPHDTTMSIEYRRSCGQGAALTQTVIYRFTFNRLD
jgi:hypothetical protein